MQGQNDTLFNLQEAVATYRGLRAQGTPVKMIWQSWGHSGGGTPAPGELDMAEPASSYEGKRVLHWFARYLKDKDVSTGPRFSYFRDWVDLRRHRDAGLRHVAPLPGRLDAERLPVRQRRAGRPTRRP